MQHSLTNSYIHPIRKVFLLAPFSCFILFFLFSLFFLVEPCLAAPVTTNALSDNNLPIKVTADDMIYDMDKNTVDFKGNVVVVRGDFILHSKVVTIYMLDKNTNTSSTSSSNSQPTPLTGKKSDPIPTAQDSNNIEKIVASNGVTFKYGTQSGQSDNAIYQAKTGVLTMHGNPIVRDGENQIQGETIRYYMYERRSEVVGTEKKRVEAIFKN